MPKKDFFGLVAFLVEFTGLGGLSENVVLERCLGSTYSFELSNTEFSLRSMLTLNSSYYVSS